MTFPSLLVQLKTVHKHLYGHNNWALPYHIVSHEATVVAVATDVQTRMMKSKQSWNVTMFTQTLMVPVALPVFVLLTTAPRRNDGMYMAYTNILHSCRGITVDKIAFTSSYLQLASLPGCSQAV